MSPRARFFRPIGGRDRVIDVHHDQILDRAEIFVDGMQVAVKKVRRAFSGLWRFQFAVEGEPLEVRVRYGLVEPTFELGAAGEQVAKKSLGWKVYAATALMSAIMLVRLRPPLGLTIVLFLVCTFVTGALISFVYART